MAKTTTDKRISVEEEIKLLKNKHRQLRQQERAEAEKAKKIRLYNRGVYLEKIAPHIAEMSDSEYEDYIKNVISPETKLAPQSAIPQGDILTKGGDENDTEINEE